MLKMNSVKPGDWNCRRCGQHNFASRRECRGFGCNEWRPKPVVSKKPGDWNCPNCNHLIFASKDKCFKCGTSKPDAGGEEKSVIRQNGDWDCVSCGDMNFGSRVVCRKCGAKRSDLGESPPSSNEDKGECTICLEVPATMAPSTCGHLSMCETCSSRVDKCPMCRSEFTQFQLIKIYQC